MNATASALSYPDTLTTSRSVVSSESKYSVARARLRLIEDTTDIINSTDTTTVEYIEIPDRNFIAHIQRLESLTSLNQLWDEDYEKPSALSKELAGEILNQLEMQEFEPSKIVASVEGGIAICFMQGDKYADIECLNSGEILGVKTNRRDRPFVWEIMRNKDAISQATQTIKSFIGKR